MCIYYVPAMKKLRCCSQGIHSLAMRETITKYHDKIMYKKYSGTERKKCPHLPEGGSRKGFKKKQS